MLMFRKFRIRNYERGFLYREGEFERILAPGKHVFFDPLRKVRVDVVSVRKTWLFHEDLDLFVKSGALGNEAIVVDLKDNERALVWVSGRFETVLVQGLHAIWNVFNDAKVELVDASGVRFEHDKLKVILNAHDSDVSLNTFVVEPNHVGLFFLEGKHESTLGPGTYAFWKDVAKVRLHHIDMRENALDVPGQELMTSDKVTLRLNAVVTYRVVDALRRVTEVEEFTQALYRDSQLALRAVVGTRELDVLLTEKDAVAAELEEALKARASAYGVEVVSLGIKDVILPGEMKDLLNRVTEARKASEAALVTRREETAAMRSQANTARILESSPTLMRLRELEVLEKVAEHSNLNVVLGEQGLTDRVVKLL
ncbi:MAG: slipin family protein [Planctomycetota bacterium]|jgi:regulator of protease activity HflC (stomatin/prohibitin superfamily)|nr:slipin family protein [Planctomycetota bacterium]MDP7251003.1 slipin family protein [Planctomycetota bacterium]